MANLPTLFGRAAEALLPSSGKTYGTSGIPVLPTQEELDAASTSQQDAQGASGESRQKYSDMYVVSQNSLGSPTSDVGYSLPQTGSSQDDESNEEPTIPVTTDGGYSYAQNEAAQNESQETAQPNVQHGEWRPYENSTQSDFSIVGDNGVPLAASEAAQSEAESQYEKAAKAAEAAKSNEDFYRSYFGDAAYDSYKTQSRQDDLAVGDNGYLLDHDAYIHHEPSTDEMFSFAVDDGTDDLMHRQSLSITVDEALRQAQAQLASLRASGVSTDEEKAAEDSLRNMVSDLTAYKEDPNNGASTESFDTASYSGDDTLYKGDLAKKYEGYEPWYNEVDGRSNKPLYVATDAAEAENDFWSTVSNLRKENTDWTVNVDGSEYSGKEADSAMQDAIANLEDNAYITDRNGNQVKYSDIQGDDDADDSSRLASMKIDSSTLDVLRKYYGWDSANVEPGDVVMFNISLADFNSIVDGGSAPGPETIAHVIPSNADVSIVATLTDNNGNQVAVPSDEWGKYTQKQSILAGAYDAKTNMSGGKARGGDYERTRNEHVQELLNDNSDNFNYGILGWNAPSYVMNGLTGTPQYSLGQIADYLGQSAPYMIPIPIVGPAVAATHALSQETLGSTLGANVAQQNLKKDSTSKSGTEIEGAQTYELAPDYYTQLAMIPLASLGEQTIGGIGLKGRGFAENLASKTLDKMPAAAQNVVTRKILPQTVGEGLEEVITDPLWEIASSGFGNAYATGLSELDYDARKAYADSHNMVLYEDLTKNADGTYVDSSGNPVGDRRVLYGNGTTYDGGSPAYVDTELLERAKNYAEGVPESFAAGAVLGGLMSPLSTGHYGKDVWKDARYAHGNIGGDFYEHLENAIRANSQNM